MGTKPPLPTPAELAVLRRLWELGPSTVRQVHEGRPRLGVRYTTVLKLLQNMYDKGLVRRDDSTRSHVYASAVDQATVEEALTEVFVNNVFEGSASRLVLRALAGPRATAEELEEVRRLADRLEQKKGRP